MKSETRTKDEERSENQAKAQLESIREMVAALRATEVDGERDDEAFEQAEITIHEDPLSVEVRSDWHTPGDSKDSKPGEYRIMLCWGGPACQIVGDLNEYGEPETARIEHQDWFTSWIDYPLTKEDEAVVLEYCRCFYFGEG